MNTLFFKRKMSDRIQIAADRFQRLIQHLEMILAPVLQKTTLKH
jgi:hypothetical protein